MFRGPSTPGTFTAIIMIVIGLFLVFLAFAPGTRLGGAFTYGKGPTVPIGSAGRLITFLIAVVILADAIMALLR